MGLFERISDARYNARRRKDEAAEYSAVISQLYKDSKEMLNDNRVARLLNDIDNAYSYNTVSDISICNKARFHQYDNAIFIYYVQPKPEQASVKWSKPMPPKTIPPTQFNFADYDLYFTADEACALLYVIFSRYAKQKPRYGEEYGEKPPWRWTFNSVEEGVKYYVKSHYTDDSSIEELSSVIGMICFPASMEK